jgi:hypothetical protein
MAMSSDAEIADFVGAVRGQQVWMVKREEGPPAAFSLSLGRKVPSEWPKDANPWQRGEYELYHGEFRL